MFKTISNIGSSMFGVGRSVKDGGVSIFNKVVTVDNAVLVAGTFVGSLYLYLIYLGIDNVRLENKILRKEAK